MKTLLGNIPDPPPWPHEANNLARKQRAMSADPLSDWRDFLLSLCFAFDPPTQRRLHFVKWMREEGRGFLEDPPEEEPTTKYGSTSSRRPPDETDAHP